MKKLNCVYVYYGLESGSERVLKGIGKTQARERAVSAIRETESLGMRAVASFIFGVPAALLEAGEENESDWRKSVELIRDARPSAVVPTVFAYYPGTKAWERLDSTRHRGYVSGVSRDERWKFFDDGYGAIHDIRLERAMQLKEYLQRELGDLLWPGRMLAGNLG